MFSSKPYLVFDQVGKYVRARIVKEVEHSESMMYHMSPEKFYESKLIDVARTGLHLNRADAFDAIQPQYREILSRFNAKQ